MLMHKRNFLALGLALAVVAGSTLATVAHAAPMPASFADLVEKYQPAVVNISTETKVEAPSALPESPFPQGSPFENSPFNELFREFFEGLPEMSDRPMQSLGSGVIISEDGYVITNAHVVQNADKIIVRLSQDNHDYDAKLVGSDAKSDIALLKLEQKRKWPFASLGNSDKARVGDWVVAVGNPFGLGGTVTAGIISARGRNINIGPYDDFLQTDAAINPGNSGGPLFNVDGEIVGINTAILTRSGGSQGIGFAIPAKTVQLIVDQLKEHGHAIRGWLGVRIQTITPELGEAFGLKENEGALVASVIEGSPAAKAGIENGDVIVSFDGQTISQMNELPRIVAQTPVGKKVKVEIIRDNKRRTLTVEVKQLEEDTQTATAEEKPAADANTLLGMGLKPLDDTLREQLKVDADIKGVIITGVERTSIAAKAGLRRGDIILEVNRKAVGSVKDLKKVFDDTKGKTVLVLVHRDGSNLFVAMRNSDD